MRVLVVGLGAIAQRHIRNIKALEPSAEIAVWRQRPDPQGWQPPEGLPVDRWFYGMDAIRDWRPDAAVVANPANLHISTAASLVVAKPMHLFIEKPLSDHMPGSLLPGIRALSEDSTLMVGYDLRFYRPLQVVKDAIDAERIGRPLSIRCEVGQYLPDWRPGRDYRTSVSAQKALGGGVLLELSHEIDYARWLMGEVVAVSAMTGRLSDLEINVEDTADILLRFASGAMGSIHLDMTDRAPVRRCRVVGMEGSIELNLLTGQADLFYQADAQPGLTWASLSEGVERFTDPQGNEPFLAEMRHFLACCRGEAVPPVSGEDGRRIVEIVEAARRSAEEGREVVA